ncbi:hypothetical protein [Massilia sp. TWR1-2-2]
MAALLEHQQFGVRRLALQFVQLIGRAAPMRPTSSSIGPLGGLI